MKHIYLLMLLFTLSCNFKEQKKSLVQYKGPIVNKVVFDSISLSETKMSTSEIVRTTVKIAYPPKTKEVKWYYIGHAPNGTGMLYITDVDDRPYNITLESIEAVSAVSSLLQASYARIDTVSKELYSYKAADQKSGDRTLRPL